MQRRGEGAVGDCFVGSKEYAQVVGHVLPVVASTGVASSRAGVLCCGCRPGYILITSYREVQIPSK